MARSCLPHAEASPGERCGAHAIRTRCPAHERAYQWWRSHQASRRLPDGRPYYGAAWQRYSRAERERQGRCAVCGATVDLTLDHATGLVGCRSCHRPDSVGGLLR